MTDHASLRVFPWINREEFKRVYRELYSSKKSLQQHALGRVEVWRSRMPKLPVAVDLTRLFVWHSTNTEVQGLDRAQILGFTIMKFVNNITEDKQRKFHKQPMTHIAAEMGIERWVVNVRHQIAHGNMPSLSMLEAAARYALLWLKKNYWEVQIQESEQPDTLVWERLDILKDLLDSYRSKKLKEFSNLTGNYGNQVDDELLYQIETSMAGLRDKSCRVLVHPDFLLSSTEQLTELSLTVADINKEETGLPEQMYSLWQPLFSIMDRIGMMASLLLCMVTEATEERSLRNRLLYGWIHMLLTNSGDWKSYVPYKHLLEISLQVINPYALQTLYRLLELVDDELLAGDKKTAIKCELETAYAHFNSDVEPESGDDSQTKQESRTDNKPKWVKCVEPVHWSNYPIGILPNQILSYKSLEFDRSAFEEEVELEQEEERDELSSEMETEDDPTGSAQERWDAGKMKTILDNIVLF